MNAMTKTAPLLAVAGVVAGIATATLVVEAGEARGEDAAPMITVDAAPIAAPDATVVQPPEGSTLPPLPPVDEDAPGFVLSSYRWVTSGNGWLAVVPILIVLSWLLMHPRMFLLKRWTKYQKFIEGKRGKVAVVMAVAALGMLAHSLAATGRPPDAELVHRLVPEVLSAMGGYEGLRILIFG